MAYTAGGLSLISSVNGFGMYRYDSLDDSTTIDVPGYFNNTDDSLNLAVGDLIWIFDWTTAVGGSTGVIADIGLHVVTLVGATGSVSMSVDMLTAVSLVTGN